MSLDVYLDYPTDVDRAGKIYIRRDGQTVEISSAEWYAMYPGEDPVTVSDGRVFSANITHNLNRMASEAGIYDCLWRPDEIGITKARELIDPLEKGLALLRSDPARFEAFNPSNGWGSYKGFVPWVERYLQACVLFPDAKVSVWR